MRISKLLRKISRNYRKKLKNLTDDSKINIDSTRMVRILTQLSKSDLNLPFRIFLV